MRFDFMIVDVFSDTPFGGNQLTVLTHARGLTAEGMQAVAREFDYPETTFVLPATDATSTRRVRIFTPRRELPFAGHPTVGTACALVMAGECAAGQVILEEGVGLVPVQVEQSGPAFSGRLRLDQSPEMPDAVAPHEDLAAVLSLEPLDVEHAFCSGMGVNFTFVQVRSRDAVDRSEIDHEAWRRLLADTWGAQLFVFAGELRDDAELYARMYAPGLGVAEDPATGSAAAALVGAAAISSGPPGAEAFKLEIVQGVKMGRPSYLSACARLEGGKLKSIEVGGGCAFVAEGKIEVPDRLLDQR